MTYYVVHAEECLINFFAVALDSFGQEVGHCHEFRGDLAAQ